MLLYKVEIFFQDKLKDTYYITCSKKKSLMMRKEFENRVNIPEEHYLYILYVTDKVIKL